MYAGEGILLSFSQGLPSSERSHLLAPLDPMGNLMNATAISEYDLGGEGDLFEAPMAIIEESVLEVDPVISVLSMISSGDDIIAGGDLMTAETIKAADMESIQNENLKDVIYECKKDLLAKSAIEAAPPPEVLDVEVSVGPVEVVLEDHNLAEVIPVQKSVSSGCLTSMGWVNGCSVRPNFLDFQALTLGDAFGMRRAYSEGDIQTLRGNCSSRSTAAMVGPSSFLFKSDARKEKLSRYRGKKSKRNFRRKIEYACRKVLADSQPRVRGRFARTEDGQ